jgi:two-component system chemotaxis response regulator CheY
MAAAKQLEVLIVDDTSVSRMLLTESLQEIGITNITLAKDGAEAFAQVKQKPVHLIISDQYMPNLDGLGLLKAVRSNAPTAKVGFILVTGSPEKSLVDRRRQMGLNNFIAKPFTTKAIRAAIEAVVGRLT